MKYFVFFDIDGTLLRSGGAGFDAMDRAAKDVLGIESMGKVAVHGRTDAAILRQLFENNGHPFEGANRTRFIERYLHYLPQTLASNSGFLLPGVSEVLHQVQASDDVGMAVLTGNMREAAKIKLQHFGLLDFFCDGRGFDVGGFGDVHEDRNQVAADARSSALNENLAVEQTAFLVVGDTVHDIACAHHIGAHSIAVLTGGASRSELADQQPHGLFDDMSSNNFVDQMLSVVA